MALGLVVTAGAVRSIRRSGRAFEHASDAMRMREAGLTALTLIGQQLQMAGFVPADVVRYDGPPPLFGCSGGRPTGADDSLACETLPSHSDGVAVRYVGDNVSTWPSTSGQATDCLGQAVTGSRGRARRPGRAGCQPVLREYQRIDRRAGALLRGQWQAGPRSRWSRVSNACGSSTGWPAALTR